MYFVSKMYKFIAFFTFCIFTQTLATSFDVRGILNGNRMASIPLGMSLGSGELDVEGVCTKSGMTCQNCTVAVTCVPLPMGWLKVFLQECKNGSTCNAHTGSCSAEPVPECTIAAEEFEHTCEQIMLQLGYSQDRTRQHSQDRTQHYIRFDKPQILAKESRYRPRMIREAIEIKKHNNFNRDNGWELPTSWDPVIGLNKPKKPPHTKQQDAVGIFPDAYDCRKFHLCSPPEGMPDGRPADHRVAMCPRHYGYNPQTAQCSIKLKSGQCSERPAPKCKNVGQHGVLALSSNHYYVCLMNNHELYPQIFICPNGWYFWGGFCQPEPEPKDNAYQTDAKNVWTVYDTNNLTDEIDRQETTSVANDINEATTTRKTSTRSMDNFFSTDKPPAYAADTFLADKFDLSNYETTDDEQPPQHDDFISSFEEGSDFWQ